MPMAFTDQGFDKWRESLLEVLPDTPASSWPGMPEEVCCDHLQSQITPAVPPPYQYNETSSATGLLPYPAHLLGLTVDTDSLDSFSDDPDFLHPALAPETMMVPPCANCAGEFGVTSADGEKPDFVDNSFCVSRVCQTGEEDDVTGSQSRGEPEFDPSEKASRKTNPHLLPPCKVCGAQATGYHYGVNSCEACKGFFHRSLLRKKPYKCYRNIKCEIKPGKRNVCGHCRYRKCLQVGMSKDGIKTGRYTYEKRTQDILEIKKEKCHLAEAKEKEWEESNHSGLEEFISKLVEAKERLLSTVEIVAKDEHSVTVVHKEAPDKLLQFPYEDSSKWTEDAQIAWRKWAATMEHSGGVRRVIKFVKTIPGFRELHISDQIQLIKHSFCEVWVIARHKFFDIKLKKYVNKVGFSFDVFQALGELDSTTLLNVACRLKAMDLSEEETALMLAFVIFFSDRCALYAPDKVDRIQETILEALQYILRKNYRRDRMRFGIKTGRYTYEKRTHDILEIKQSHLIKAEINTKQFEESHQLDLEHLISQLVDAKEKLLSDVELVTRDDHGITGIHKGCPDQLIYIPSCVDDSETDLIGRTDQAIGGNIWKKWATVVQHTGGVNRLVKFVKIIPGFRDLEMTDQIQLIKHAFCEIWVILRHPYFDVERKLYTYKVGFSFDVVRAFGETESSTLVRLARRLQNLDLSDQEVSLMMAFVTFFSDRCSLIDPQKIDSIQETILKALQYELHRHHSAQKSRFGKIMDIFIELRSITELYHHLSEKALSSIGEMAPLLWEIINLS